MPQIVRSGLREARQEQRLDGQRADALHPLRLYPQRLRVTAVTARPDGNGYGWYMSGPTPIETLEAEHRVIEKAVAEMTAAADRIESAGQTGPEPIETLIEFLREFADRRHHGKEEQLLFPALERRGVPSQGCPLGGLTMEHQRGRAMVGDLAGNVRAWRDGDPGAPSLVAANLRALAAFYTNHIWKEDNLLFPLAAKVLTPADQAELAEKFEGSDAICPITST